ncbi:MAG: hypothetical protein HY321_14350 [Armatimonadetes bacterium]|nr:hypothetical protein [Armatimonadota bacterium]
MPEELRQGRILEQLRKQAKALRKRHRTGAAAARLLTAFHPALRGEDPQEILVRPVRLCDAQLATARRYGFPVGPGSKPMSIRSLRPAR